MELKTERLLLRQWCPADIEPFAALNADAQVMEFFPKLLSLDETKAMVARIEKHFQQESFGLWAVEIIATSKFIGFVGLNRPIISTHFTPCVEVGWRISHDYWGQGFAPEAAQEAMRDGFERFNFSEIVAFTPAVNQRSRRVMEKLHMTRNASDDFLHPSVKAESHLNPHVLYRLSKPA